MNRTMIISALGSIVVASCTSLPPRPGFDEVLGDVQSRLAQRVYWRQGGPEDEAVDGYIDELLKQPLTPDAAVQIALLSNRRLQAIYEELGVAQAQVVQAGLLTNPVLDAAIKFPAGDGITKIDFGIALNFLDVFFIPLRKSVAEAEFEQARWRVIGAVLDLAAKTRSAFIEAQANHQRVEMFEQVVSSTSASYDAMRQLYEAGNVTTLMLRNEQALRDEARLGLASARLRQMESRERLTELMGLWGHRTSWSVESSLPAISDESMPLEDAERQAVANSLDLAAVRSRIEARGRSLGLTRTASLLRRAEAGATAERDDGNWYIGPVVTLPIPLFDQGQARVASAQAVLRQSLHEYEALAVQVRAALRLARDRYVAAERVARFYRDEILPLRSQILADTFLQYNAMQIGVFELLVAKQQQIDAGRRYIDALEAYWLARVDLEQILSGHLSSRWLNDAPRSLPVADSMGMTTLQEGH